jgi:hypothetical protein
MRRKSKQSASGVSIDVDTLLRIENLSEYGDAQSSPTDLMVRVYPAYDRQD